MLLRSVFKTIKYFRAVILLALLPGFVFAQEREGDLAVMEMVFSGQGLSRTQVESLSDLIRAKAVDLTKYRVMTKENNLTILRDKKVDLARCADAECVIEFGRILKADKLVTSNLLLSEGTYYLTLKFYDVASASIDKVLDPECKACDFSKLRQMVKEAAREILGGVEEVGELKSGTPTEKSLEPPKTQAAGSGALEVNTNPPGCQIYVDSEEKGLSPLSLPNVPAGERTIVLAKAGYSTTTEVIQIRKGQKLVLNKTLAPQMGNISVSVGRGFSPAEGAQVFLDGKYKGVVIAGKPLKITNILAGSHKVRSEHQDYEPKEETIEVRHNATEELEVDLAGKPGKVLITSTPLKAKVSVDGTEKGETPFSAVVSPGRHSARVALKGYKSKEQEIEVKPNKPLSLSFDLEALPKGQMDVGEGLVPSRDMALIPAGEFMMGCNSAVDNKCGNDEKPYHRVYLDAYYIDKYEVTVAEYEKCVNAGKCSAPMSKSDNQYCNWGYSDRGNHPVNCVDWNQASAYCEWVGKRLPTEAEWEKAARGTDGRVYPYGNQFDCGKSCNSVSPCSHSSTCPVGSYAQDKSPYGVMDMAGNVWEWVQDWYADGYYKNSPARNPQGASSGQYRALRGGSWDYYFPGTFRASARFGDDPSLRLNFWGFRCARSDSQMDVGRNQPGRDARGLRAAG